MSAAQSSCSPGRRASCGPHTVASTFVLPISTYAEPPAAASAEAAAEPTDLADAAAVLPEALGRDEALS